ncbi:MAG: methyltransferase, partial [Oscillospiraceae bacterium]|nr:methyltransferase [Oscillospiraceae bacterium]
MQLKNGLKLFVESTEQPSIVPWLLGSFASLKGNQNVLEFCAGNGAASLWCVDNGFRGNILLLDQRANALQLAEKTIDQNHLSAIKTICSSVETFRSSEKFDCILCNPPFFSESFISKDDDLRAIRHEGGLTLDELCMSSAMSLKQKGHFYLCHTPSRLSEIILSLDKNKFEI